MIGFSFVVEGRTDRDGEPIVLKGSDVGAKWSMLKELVDYEVGRDGEFLKAVKEESARRLNEIRAQAGSKDAGGDVAGHIVGDEGDGRHDTQETENRNVLTEFRAIAQESFRSLKMATDGKGIVEVAGSDEDVKYKLSWILLTMMMSYDWSRIAGVVAADVVDATAGDEFWN